MQQHSLWGAFLVIGGALLLSAKGIFAKLLYAQGLEFDTLVAVRSALAVPFFWVWAFWKVGPRALTKLKPAYVADAVFAGLLCYCFGAYLNFFALTLIDASLERVLLFSYPALVVGVQAFLEKRWPSRRVLLALASTYAGVFLVVGGFDPTLLRANAQGAALVLVCAGTLAYYFFANARVANRIGSVPFAFFGMTAAGLGLTTYLYATKGWPGFHVPPDAWPTMWVMVLAVTVLPLLMLAEGVKLIGAERSSILSTVGPPSTLLIAWIALDERMTGWQLAGTLAIIVGILILEIRRARPLAETG